MNYYGNEIERKVIDAANKGTGNEAIDILLGIGSVVIMAYPVIKKYVFPAVGKYNKAMQQWDPATKTYIPLNAPMVGKNKEQFQQLMHTGYTTYQALQKLGMIK